MLRNVGSSLAKYIVKHSVLYVVLGLFVCLFVCLFVGWLVGWLGGWLVGRSSYAVGSTPLLVHHSHFSLPLSTETRLGVQLSRWAFRGPFVC